MARFDLESYVDVQERIARFWSEYPKGAILTQLVSEPSDFERVVFFAGVYKQQDQEGPDATGYAAETKGSGGANQTSWHENAETSAIGRALANLGYATSGKDRPSRQEMSKADNAHTAPVVAVARPNAAKNTNVPTKGSNGGVEPPTFCYPCGAHTRKETPSKDGTRTFWVCQNDKRHPFEEVR